jgi:hypothetical protein
VDLRFCGRAEWIYCISEGISCDGPESHWILRRAFRDRILSVNFEGAVSVGVVEFNY